MTTVNFDYDHEFETMYFKTIDGLGITIHFKNDVAEYISFNGWDDIDIRGGKIDNIKGLYADASLSLLCPDPRPIVWFIEQATNQIADARSEGNIEAQNWARHVNSYSTPR